MRAPKFTAIMRDPQITATWRKSCMLQPIALCREQLEVEERRHMPRGGRALRVPAGKAMWSPGCAWSQCGPDGVSWIMVAFTMPNGTCEYRLIHLGTGAVHMVLTLGREPDSYTDDEEES